MSMTRSQRDQALDWLRDVLDADLSRLVLSILIILSVLPFQWVQDYALVFFGCFAVELTLRVSLLRQDLRRRSLSRVEVVFLVVDLLATLSFLPIEVIYDDARYLRLLRLSRMMLLVGYWGPIVREIWFIMSKRERRYQLVFVVAATLILSFVAAVLLNHFHTAGVDFNEDGNTRNDKNFWSLLWWSFRQIQDPGNMLKDPDASLAFFFSVGLTVAGMFVFSFLVGIGASVVDELVSLGKQRRLGMRRHSVICNVGPHSQVLLEELVTYYAKSLRPPRIVVMGPAAARYAYMLQGPPQRVRYRQGRPLSRHDLQRVDADRATRVILLGEPGSPQSDSEVVSQVLGVREVNPDCEIYAELQRPDNVRAVEEAGGERTVPVLADRMVGLFLANIILFPGVQQLYRELLSSLGDEIYTCVYERGAMAGATPPSGPLMPFGELLHRAHRGHGVVLLGYLVRDARAPHGFRHVLNPRRGADGAAVPPVNDLVGFFGVSDNFGRLKGVVESLPDVAATRGPPPEPALPPRFGPCSGSGAVSRLLICGFRPGLVELCEQLALACEELELFIMVPAPHNVEGVVRAFERRPHDEEAAPDSAPAAALTFTSDGPGVLRYHAEEGVAHRGVVRVLCGDWSDERTLLGDPDGAYALERMDAVLLTYEPAAPDPDAHTSLALIKLMRLREAGTEAMRRVPRVVCEVQSTDKAELFRRRYGRSEGWCGRRGPWPVAVVAAEKLRNALLAQAVFVPGIAAIYRELLSHGGQEIRRLHHHHRGDSDEVWTFTELLYHLYERRGWLLLGLELEPPEGEDHPVVVVNPRPRDDHYRFRAADLRGVFVVGGDKE